MSTIVQSIFYLLVLSFNSLDHITISELVFALRASIAAAVVGLLVSIIASWSIPQQEQDFFQIVS